MASEDTACSFLTLTRTNRKLSCSCSNCFKGGVRQDSLDVVINLIIISGPKAVILPVNAYRAFLYSTADIMTCPASEAYDRIHAADYVVTSPVISDQVRMVIANGLTAMGYDNHSSWLDTCLKG